jgi:hypothetical protein
MGPDYALALSNTLKSDTAWYFSEYEMNELGYHLLLKSDLEKHTALAVEVFKINTLLSPKSSNVYDSYAEGLMALGLKEEADMMYKKARLKSKRAAPTFEVGQPVKSIPSPKPEPAE